VVKGAWNMGHEWFDFCIFDATLGREAQKGFFQGLLSYGLEACQVHFTESISSFTSILGFAEESFLINLEKNLSWMLLWGTFAFVALSCWEENYNFFERSTFSFLCILPLQKWWKKDQSSLFFFLLTVLNRTENVPQLFFFLYSSLSHLTLTAFANQEKCLISKSNIIIFPNVIKCCKM